MSTQNCSTGHKINREHFYATVRASIFGGKLKPTQLDGMGKILDGWEKEYAQHDDRFLAYMLATTFHETAATMQPVREYGGEAYLKKKPYYPWVGEGLVQVTWEVNHRKFGGTKPGQLLTWPIALKALFEGMIKGMFTGKKLADYFNKDKSNWIGARRIINGTDRAQLIAGYAKFFYAALSYISA